MARQILFIGGGGDNGYEVDKALVRSLQENLGDEYEIAYPELTADESLPDFGWVRQIEEQVLKSENQIIVVAHSVGASLLLKYLSENPVNKKIKGVFLIATPFWSGNEDWKAGLKLNEGFADRLPRELPLFFYHCRDDEEVPFSHLQQYKSKVSRAIFHEIGSGGHQLGNDLALVAQDVKSLR